MRVNQSFKQKINLYFFVRFVCINHKKLLAQMLWKGTLGYVSFWTNNVLTEILSNDGYCHTEVTSLQNTEECKFVMAINLLKSVLTFIKDRNNKNPTRD